MTCSKLGTLREKIASASKGAGGTSKILIAFSGGVDSGLLLKIAQDILGEAVFAVTLDAEIMPRSELKHAEQFVKALGCDYEIVKFPILDNKDFVKGSRERCYYCKKESAKILAMIGADKEIKSIADGVNISDFDEYRPGIKASDEAGIWHPFVDAGITKSDIRDIAKEIGLEFWDKPSSACLATRIPYGDEITKDKLEQIERAEEILRGKGFRFQQVRARIHGEIVRIEVTAGEIDQALRLRTEIIRELKGIGFKYITLDLEGYRSGSMDVRVQGSGFKVQG
ncbi:MAG: ATP-dependent sacrificial sulfur transferase LarE [Methanophagales archaeon]|nr:ATP-dependent sacrificial sulfur transferase LarE [Methanophagales archaeon]